MEDYIIIFELTANKNLKFLSFCSVARLPASPTAKKKQKQWLNMSPEKKKAQQDKVRLSKKTKHQAESLEETEQCKHNNNIIMKRCCEAESLDAAATYKKINRENMKRYREAESTDKAATRIKSIRENMKRHRMVESPDAASTQKNIDKISKKRKHQDQQQNVINKISKKRKCQDQQQNVSTVCHDKEMTNAIKRSMKEAKQILHRTQYPANPHSHRAIVCICVIG